jgi:hypothetical protein
MSPIGSFSGTAAKTVTYGNDNTLGTPIMINMLHMLNMLIRVLVAD